MPVRPIASTPRLPLLPGPILIEPHQRELRFLWIRLIHCISVSLRYTSVALFGDLAVRSNIRRRDARGTCDEDTVSATEVGVPDATGSARRLDRKVASHDATRLLGEL